MKRERVGYYGGTFDPPHLGHIILAAETQYHLELDTFYWIITPEPPHKKDRIITPVKQRLEMLELVAEEYGTFLISDVDVKRDPPHYAVDTVKILKNDHPSGELVYIIGEDSLRDLPDWHEPNQFISSIDQLAIVPRPHIITDLKEMDRILPGLSEKTVFIPEILLEISSSVIRKRVVNGAPFEHFLTGKVADYIRSNGLYLPDYG